MLELAFVPDRRAPAPVYRQLADHLGALIEGERLRSGEKLPASRELAGALGLSRNTVNQAYQALIDRDLLRAHVGQGTFVSERPGGSRAPLEAEPARAFVWESLLSGPARALPVRLPGEPRGTPDFDFRAGRVDPASLPVAELQRLFRRVLEEHSATLANHLDPRGWPPLREAIATALVARGIWCEPDEVLVTGGAQAALDAIARVLIDPDDAVALESPGYFGADFAFRAARAHRIPIPVDEGGLRTDDLARVLGRRRLKLVYTTPAVQQPTGVAMIEERREQLLELAAATHTPIVEDDYDGELRLEDPVRPALKTRDPAGQIVYVGTFSKALFPALRLGYVVAARPLLDRLATARMASALAVPALEQAVLADWMASEGYARHVRRVRRNIAERVRAGLETLAAVMPEGTSVGTPAGGGSLWITLPEPLDGEALRRAARDVGILVTPGAWFATGDASQEPLARTLSIAVGALPEGDVREGLGRLGECARQGLGRRSARSSRARRRPASLAPIKESS